MGSRQLEAIKLKLEDIRPEVTAEDKRLLVEKNICSMGTITEYIEKGNAKTFELANRIYKFCNKRIETREKELNS